MNELKLGLRDNRTQFRPGDEITGAAGWKLDQPPDAVEVRLFWRTEGKGTSDTQVVHTARFDKPSPEDARPFAFTAPNAPYSFSGKLVSLVWALEMVIKPGNDASRIDVIIAPAAQEILLHKPA